MWNFGNSETSYNIDKIKYTYLVPIKWKGNNDDIEKMDGPKEVEGFTFRGLTVMKIPEFNKCLINSMKKIYAYNPDYNTRIVKKGKVSV
jgi:hypothetical protein